MTDRVQNELATYVKRIELSLPLETLYLSKFLFCIRINCVDCLGSTVCRKQMRAGENLHSSCRVHEIDC